MFQAKTAPIPIVWFDKPTSKLNFFTLGLKKPIAKVEGWQWRLSNKGVDWGQRQKGNYLEQIKKTDWIVQIKKSK